ncbi:MAG TPA: pyridoxamine 5'-phosphate oxidase family protein [Micromonosporaceae bacterium]|nr:pyridoxamine 5'-phosphate oxidase family protein [Micromonosporaceae bacterium]
MVFWSEFSAAAPDVARAVRALLCQYGPGLGYLATVRPDGAPRIHPVSPVIADGGLFCFLLDSPKRRDLQRDGRYALHAYPAETSDDEASLSGLAWPVTDAARRRRVAEAVRAAPRVDWQLFELTVEVALVVRRRDELGGLGAAGRAGLPVERLVWRDESRLLQRVS